MSCLTPWLLGGPGLRGTILLIAAVGPFLGSPALLATIPEVSITDSEISAVVESELRLEKGVAPQAVAVSTRDRITTLSGAVDNLLAQERAVKLAEGIRGVEGVIDRIVVTPAVRPDEDLRHDLQAALKQDPATQSYPVEVSIKDGAATLTGTVGSHGDQQLAARIAAGIIGIRAVVNRITISYAEKRSDRQIAGDVTSRLHWDLWINGGSVDATVKAGKVTLTGTVGSAIGKSRASDDAWVNGVTSVAEEGLKVDPSANPAPPRVSAFGTPPDRELKDAILASLRLDPRVAAFALNVTVESGVIILGGDVDNLKAKVTAEQDARNIVGVWQVDNLIKVANREPITAAQAEKQLKAALFWDPLLVGVNVDVAVVHGNAYLSGAVGTSSEKTEAQDVASKIKGVIWVRNHLHVQPEAIIAYDDDWDYNSTFGWPFYSSAPFYAFETYGPHLAMSDEQIKQKIERALFWSPFVGRNDVKVTVDGAVATLTGTVGTWIGWAEADKDAHKSGATAVWDRVAVNPRHGW